MKKLKLIVSYVRLITCLLLHRNFGNFKFCFRYQDIEVFVPTVLVMEENDLIRKLRLVSKLFKIF